MEYGRTYIRLAIRYDIQTLIVGGVEHCALAHVTIYCGVVVRDYVYLANAIYAVILAYGLATLVVTRDVAAHNHSYAHLAVATQRIDTVLNVIYREVVVTTVVEICRYALSLLVQRRDVEYVTHLQQRLRCVGLDNGGNISITEVVRYALYAVWLALMRAVGDVCSLRATCGIYLVLDARRVVTT